MYIYIYICIGIYIVDLLFERLPNERPNPAVSLGCIT